MSSVTIQNVTKSFGNTVVLENFDAVFQNGEFITLLGPSGCGKTTMLRIIAGFEKPTSGCVKFDDRVVSSDKVFIPPEKRDIGMVFQSYAVWPHMTVFDNVAYPLRIKKMDKDVIQKKVDRVLAMVHLTQYAQRIPSQLSGGQQQRVALARALVVEPSVLLFDEPLSNLDAKLRVSMRTEIRRIQHTLGITAVYVTHDQAEAMSISDRIIVMKGGVIEQMGTPKECYYHPANAFVADFIGEANFLDGEIRETLGAECRVTINGKDVLLKNPDGFRAGQKVQMVLRPEAARIGETGMLPCRVALSCFMGAYQNYHVIVGSTLIKIADYCPVNKRIFEVDETAYLSFDADCVHILNAEA